VKIVILGHFNRSFSFTYLLHHHPVSAAISKLNFLAGCTA